MKKFIKFQTILASLLAVSCLVGCGENPTANPTLDPTGEPTSQPSQVPSVEVSDTEEYLDFTDLSVRDVIGENGVVAAANPYAAKALDCLDELRGCECHSTVILSQVDTQTFKKLGLNLTCEPKYRNKKLYHA